MTDITNNSESIKLPSEFKDPFNKDSVDRVYYEFHRTKSFMRGNCFHRATIYLENNNTQGIQNFYNDDHGL